MIVIKKIRPLNNQVITTAEKYVEERYIPGTSIIDSSKSKSGLKEYQKVVEIGPMVRNIKPGDMVCINPAAYENRKYRKGDLKADMEEYDNHVVSYNFNMVLINNVDYLQLTDRDIDFVLEEYEEVANVAQLTDIDKNIVL